MTPDTPGYRLALMRRAIGVVVQSTLWGGVVGLIGGSVIPLYGTMVGGVVGLPTGFLVGCFVLRVIVRKPFTSMLALAGGWASLTAFMTAVFAWVVGGSFAVLMHSWRTPSVMSYILGIGSVLTVGVIFFGSVIVYCLVIIRRSRVTARSWPFHEGGLCQRCGYALEGLRGSVCPECGQTNEPVAGARG